MVCFILRGACFYIYILGPVWGFLINVNKFHLGRYIHCSIVKRSFWILWILTKNLFLRCIQNQHKNDEINEECLTKSPLEESIHWHYIHQHRTKTCLEISKMKSYGKYSNPQFSAAWSKKFVIWFLINGNKMKGDQQSFWNDKRGIFYVKLKCCRKTWAILARKE